jgi:sulfur carrier protein
VSATGGTCRVNGAEHALPSPPTVAALLAEYSFGVGMVVVELNGTALTRPEATVATLAEGDRVEIVRAVAGG